jgi:hypothetical protein
MVLASIGETLGFGWIIVVLIFVLVTRQWCKWIKGNDALRGAAKWVSSPPWGRLFK